MTPLIILVGFLGSGKTTYLRRLLPLLGERNVDPHVIINDYQNARVDAELVRDLAQSVMPISGSCVCCGSRDELLGALENFEHRPGRAVVIETNGTTDAEELVELLSLEPGLNKFTLPVQISLIDAKRWQKRFWHNGLERDQAKTASFVHLSYADQVDGKRMDQVMAGLKNLGLQADACPPDAAAAMIESLVRETAAKPGRSHSGSAFRHNHDHHAHSHDEHGHDASDHHHHGEHHEHFASMQINLPELVNRDALEGFLRALPDEVLRAKGIVRLADEPDEFFVFQKVEHSVQLLPIGKENRLGASIAILIGAKIPVSAVSEAEQRFFPKAAAGKGLESRL